VKKLLEIHQKQKAFENEISFLMGIKHQNVVQFVGYCAESRWEAIEQPSGSGKHILAEIPKRLLCFEYVSNKSLDIHIAGTVK
jgi:serine/threonine protein kinase